MKYKIKSILLFGLILFSGLAGWQTLAVSPVASAAASPDVSVACYYQYNGQADSLGNISFSVTTLPAYKKSDCDTNVGGPCSLKMVKKFQTITCTKPSTSDIATYCTDKYDGTTYGQDKSGNFSGDLANDYSQHCDSAAKGPCTNSNSSISCTASPQSSGSDCAAKGLVQSSVDTSCVTPTTTDPALAGCTDSSTDANEQACGLIGKYVNPLIRVLSAAVGVAVAIAIAYGGILYSTSGGDQARVTKAKSLIRNAVLSLVAFVFLYSFVQFIVPGGIFNK